MLPWFRSVKSARLLALLLVFTYGFVVSVTAFHRHNHGTFLVSQTEKQVHTPKAEMPCLSAADCDLCHFAAMQINGAPCVEPPPSAVLIPLTRLVPSEPPAAFVPARFCDRSAARAPPFFA